MAEKFRYLENDVGSMLVGAACYPLSSDETSTVAMGARTEHKAEINFGVVPGKRLSGEALQAVRAIQRRLRLHYRTGRMVDALKDTFPELSAPGRQTESSDIS